MTIYQFNDIILQFFLWFFFTRSRLDSFAVTSLLFLSYMWKSFRFDELKSAILTPTVDLAKNMYKQCNFCYLNQIKVNQFHDSVFF